MSRYYAKCFNKRKDSWGIVDREAGNTYVLADDGTRWQSSKAGAFIITDRWNREGRS